MHDGGFQSNRNCNINGNGKGSCNGNETKNVARKVPLNPAFRPSLTLLRCSSFVIKVMWDPPESVFINVGSMAGSGMPYS